MSIIRLEEAEPIIIELVTRKGEAKRYTSRSMTPAVMMNIIQIGEEKELDKTQEPKLCRQMAVIFGGNAKEYSAYDVRLLSKAIKALMDEIRNPLTPEQEPEPNNSLQKPNISVSQTLSD